MESMAQLSLKVLCYHKHPLNLTNISYHIDISTDNVPCGNKAQSG